VGKSERSCSRQDKAKARPGRVFDTRVRDNGSGQSVSIAASGGPEKGGSSSGYEEWMKGGSMVTSSDRGICH
jgi:hypothetical protein